MVVTKGALVGVMVLLGTARPSIMLGTIQSLPSGLGQDSFNGLTPLRPYLDFISVGSRGKP